jgi:hypothetical protein
MVPILSEFPPMSMICVAEMVEFFGGYGNGTDEGYSSEEIEEIGPSSYETDEVELARP